MLRLKGALRFLSGYRDDRRLAVCYAPQTAAAQSEPVTAAVEQDTTKTDAGGYESYLAGLTGFPPQRRKSVSRARIT